MTDNSLPKQKRDSLLGPVIFSLWCAKPSSASKPLLPVWPAREGTPRTHTHNVAVCERSDRCVLFELLICVVWAVLCRHCRKGRDGLTALAASQDSPDGEDSVSQGTILLQNHKINKQINQDILGSELLHHKKWLEKRLSLEPAMKGRAHIHKKPF